MKNLNFTPEHNKEANPLSHFSNELKQLWTSIALASALITGNPSPTQAETTKKSTQTEQVEKMEAPDYISQAPAKLKEYYPEEEAYFQKFFELLESAWPEITSIANLKLEEQFKEFAEDFVDEKEKWTAVFMFCELSYPADVFTKKLEKLDEFWIDIRETAAKEALNAMTIYFVREDKKAELALQESEKRLEKVKKEREEMMQNTEELFREIEIGTIKEQPEIAELVRHYGKLCEKNGRTPTEKAQKLIDQLPENQKKK